VRERLEAPPPAAWLICSDAKHRILSTSGHRHERAPPRRTPPSNPNAPRVCMLRRYKSHNLQIISRLLVPSSLSGRRRRARGHGNILPRARARARARNRCNRRRRCTWPWTARGGNLSNPNRDHGGGRNRGGPHYAVRDEVVQGGGVNFLIPITFHFLSRVSFGKTAHCASPLLFSAALPSSHDPKLRAYIVRAKRASYSWVRVSAFPWGLSV